DTGLVEFLEVIPKLLRRQRGGNRGANDLQRTLRAFAIGKQREERKQEAPRERSVDEQKRAKALRAVDMARRGHLGKAMDILIQAPPLDVSAPGVLERLHAMHRVAVAPVALPPLPAGSPMPAILEPRQFAAACRKAANG